MPSPRSWPCEVLTGVPPGDELVVTRSRVPAHNPFIAAVHPVGLDTWLSAEIINRGVVEPELLAVLEAHVTALAGSAPIHIVDVGANIGFVSIFSAAVSNRVRVTSVEATPWHYKVMELSLRLNPDLAEQVRLFKTGLGPPQPAGAPQAELCMQVESRNGAATFATSGPCSTDALATGGVSVPLRTLDSVLEDSWGSQVEVLKMDVEGYEPLVMSGFRLLNSAKPPRLILTEYIPFRVIRAFGGGKSAAEAFDAYFSNFGDDLEGAWDISIIGYNTASTAEALRILRGWSDTHSGGDVVLRSRKW